MSQPDDRLRDMESDFVDPIRLATRFLDAVWGEVVFLRGTILGDRNLEQQGCD